MARVGTGTITALVIGVIMLTVLFSVAVTVIPTGATAFHNLSDALAGDGDIIGTDAAAFAGNTDTYVGWFWVIGPFVLMISLVIGLFLGRGGRRR